MKMTTTLRQVTLKRRQIDFNRRRRAHTSSLSSGLGAAELITRQRMAVGNAVAKAIKEGRLIRPTTCSRCHKENCPIAGHHKDYNKPLDVEWLCLPCHSHVHGRGGKPIKPLKCKLNPDGRYTECSCLVKVKAILFCDVYDERRKNLEICPLK